MVENEKKSYWRDSMIVFGRMSGWIAGPILIGLFLGKYLDKKLGTAPILFATTIGIAFLASSFGIVLEAKKYMRKVEKETSQKDTKNTTAL